MERTTMPLLERDDLLDALSARLGEVVEAGGHVALVMGEAGVGKTSLVGRFAAGVPQDVPVLWGACEALFTPRPLGPLYDIAFQSGGDLRRYLESGGSRAALFPEVLGVLQRRAPLVVVLEDVHWADDATLDLIKFLGRRIHLVGALLVATYRDDEVGASHPLRLVLGDLPRPRVSRFPLAPLSAGAVAEMARQAGRPDADLYAVTGGNPFFVSEVLAGEAGGVPASVRDAVQARVARLPPDAREVLDLASVVPARVERWLLDEVLGPAPEAVDECVEAGMLRVDGDALAFRHELARLAVDEALPPARRSALHCRVLGGLERRAPGEVARLVHHAAQAGDGTAVLRYAPEAARQAAALSAHREAAAHYGTALRFAEGCGPEVRADLLEGRSFECYLTDQIDEALDARREAVRIREQQGDPTRRGDNLRWMSRLSWFLGRKADADQFATEAIGVLEAAGPGPELAMAYSNRAQLHMLAGETAEAVRWGSAAAALAERVGALDTLSHALNNVGTALGLAGDPAGTASLEESLRLALDLDHQEHAARAYTNLASGATRLRDYWRANRYLDDGIAYATERDLDAWRLYMTAWRARSRFEQGDWAGAADDAAWVLERPRVSAITRIPALAVLGHVRVRRGDPEAAAVLDEARALAEQTGEIQRIAPVASARAEAAWLAGDSEGVERETREAYALALVRSDRWTLGDLALWRWRAGALAEVPPSAAEPYRLQAAGAWREAATVWERVGCPFEQAMAMAEGDAPAVHEALALLDRLGAGPATERLRQKLRADGVQDVARPRRSHPSGLTPRQVEVLALLAEGLTNAEIADRLYISAKTVDHHVSAVLATLGVRSRGDAAAQAQSHGWLG